MPACPSCRVDPAGDIQSRSFLGFPRIQCIGCGALFEANIGPVLKAVYWFVFAAMAFALATDEMLFKTIAHGEIDMIAQALVERAFVLLFLVGSVVVLWMDRSRPVTLDVGPDGHARTEPEHVPGESGGPPKPSSIAEDLKTPENRKFFAFAGGAVLIVALVIGLGQMREFDDYDECMLEKMKGQAKALLRNAHQYCSKRYPKTAPK